MESQEQVVEKCESLKLRSLKSKVKQIGRDHYLRQSLACCVQKKKAIPMFCASFSPSFRSKISVCVWKTLILSSWGRECIYPAQTQAPALWKAVAGLCVAFKESLHLPVHQLSHL